MKHTDENLEYSARFGLKHALDNIEKAIHIAIAKYKSIVKRQLLRQEMLDLRWLVQEFRNLHLQNTMTRSLIGTSW